MKKWISMLIVSFSLLCFPLNCLAFDNNELLGYEDKGEILGLAQEFAVFVEEDFGANGADCEGRLFVGGSANLGNMQWYSTKRVGSAASAIIQGNTLKNFDSGDRIFVVGENTNVEIQSNNIVRAKLIDTEKEFENLREVSKQWSTMESIVPRLDGSTVELIGESQVNYFYLEDIDSCNYFFDYKVPSGSYCIVNIPGKNPTIYTQLYGCGYANNRITNNADRNSRHIIFNLYEAETFKIEGYGTFYGSILAPNANGYDDMSYGAHETGSVIAKSYFGGIEFGGIGFDLKESDDEKKEDESKVTESSKVTEETKQETDTVTQKVTSGGATEKITETTTNGTTKKTTTTTKKVTTTTTTTTEEIGTTTTKTASPKVVTTTGKSSSISETKKETTAGTAKIIRTETGNNPKTGEEDDNLITIIFLSLIVVGLIFLWLRKIDKK